MRSKLVVTAGLFAHAFFAPISIAGTQIGLGVAAAGLLLAMLEGFRPRRTPLDLPALAFVIVCVLSDLWSPFGAPPLAFATLWRSVLGFFVVYHSLALLDDDRMVYAAAVGLGLASVVGLIQYRTGVDVVYLLHLRAQPALVEAPGVPGRFGAMGFFTSRLTFGHCATLLVALLATRKRAWPAVALALMAIVVTFDRSAYLGLLAAGVALVVTLRSRVLIGVLAALVLAAALHPGVRQRFRSSFDTSSNSDRVFIWARAREIIADHPLRGIGFGNYPRVCPRYYDRVDPSFPMRTWAHNTFLSLYAETGPLGLVAFVALIAVSAWIAPVPVVAFLVMAQFHDLVYDTKVMYPLWLAVATALWRRSRPAKSG